MVDENSAILTVILGEDITESEESKLSESLFEQYPELEIDIKRGQQPVYSFLVGVE
jgi:dihydroxyacetone kinase-like predicted kinase